MDGSIYTSRRREGQTEGAGHFGIARRDIRARAMSFSEIARSKRVAGNTTPFIVLGEKPLLHRNWVSR